MGPLAGRRAGFCAGCAVPGYANPGPGMGAGWAAGWGGRGWRNCYYATRLPGWVRGPGPGWGAAPAAPTPDQEVEGLRAQEQYLTEMLDDVRARLQRLTGSETTE
jgi:hypothetical protein